MPGAEALAEIILELGKAIEEQHDTIENLVHTFSTLMAEVFETLTQLHTLDVYSAPLPSPFECL